MFSKAESAVQAFFDEEWQARQAELEEGQANAAKRTIRKMEEKVRTLNAPCQTVIVTPLAAIRGCIQGRRAYSVNQR